MLRCLQGTSLWLMSYHSRFRGSKSTLIRAHLCPSWLVGSMGPAKSVWTRCKGARAYASSVLPLPLANFPSAQTLQWVLLLILMPSTGSGNFNTSPCHVLVSQHTFTLSLDIISSTESSANYLELFTVLKYYSLSCTSTGKMVPSLCTTSFGGSLKITLAPLGVAAVAERVLWGQVGIIKATLTSESCRSTSA